MTKHSYSKNLFVIICFLALLSVSPILFAQDAKPFIGIWNGSISAGGQVFEIVVEFSLDEEGKIQGNMILPARSTEDLGLINIALEGKKISFGIEGPPGEPILAGELDEAGTKIEGKFSLAGTEGTFTMEKAEL